MIRKFSISRDDGWYEAWPDVVLTKGGKLICVFTQTTHHGDRSASRIMLIESADRGRTWTNKRALTGTTSGMPYWNCARISRLGGGRLAIVADRISGPRETGARNCLWFADGEGTEWSGPFETPLEGIVPDKLLELPSGRWLLSAHDREGQWLRYSDNEGAEWSEPVLVAAQEGLKLCEASILPLEDGTLVAFLRENSGEGRDCYKTISSDSGESWSEPYRVPLPGCHRPVAGLLRSGTVLITYRFMQGGKGWLGKWTQNFFAAITDQESAAAKNRKEQWARIMPVDYDRSPASDLGYSGWVQFGDGEIYVVNYIVDDAPKGQIRGYSIREKDFLLEPGAARGE